MPILNWLGRDEALKTAAKTPYRLLEEVPELGYGDKSADNMIIQGDNLEALKALLPFYAGQVKCIYIDPPYNTGNAFDHYDDNVEHSIWLSLMYPRLELLREFLNEDGSIWISIDDRESAYLKVICDEVFGRKNFVSAISWQRTYSPRNDAKGISSEAEQILVYSKNEGWSPNKLPRTAKMDSKYKNPDNDIDLWRTSDAFAPSASTHQGMVYAIQHPITGEMIYPYKNACWPLKQTEMLAIMNEWCNYELKDLDDDKERADVCGISGDEIRKGVLGIVLSDSLEEAKRKAQAIYKRGQWPRFFFTKNGLGGIARKTYLKNTEGKVVTNLWVHDEAGHTDEAKKEVKLFNMETVFATPKPERLIQRVINVATNPNDLVLDSFLGSGTTAAVAQKMGRRYIGIEMGNHAITHCVPRLKAVVDGEQGGISKAVNWQGGGGFRFFKLGDEVFDADGCINENISFENLSAHIWFTETKTPFNKPAEKSTFLGIKDNVAYALLYNGILKDKRVDGGNVLTNKTLKVILDDMKNTPYDKLVIYGESSRISQPRLKSLNIEFKQTPYDIKAR